MTTFFSNFLTFGLLLTSVFTIISKNPVISVIFLITTFVLAAVYLILLGVNFIGISYVVIYVGAIAVLFLFVIMMINIKLTDILESGSNYTKNLPLAICFITLFLSAFYKGTAILSSLSPNPFQDFFDLGVKGSYYAYSNILPLDSLQQAGLTHNSDLLFANFEQIEVLGHNLYTFGAILLIILSMILLLAMLATIVISKKNVNI